MKTNIQKLSVLLIAAVLLVGVAFAGAASAVSITADVWNQLDANQINGNSTYEFTGGGIINPKFNDGSNSFTPTRDIMFDFKDFTGTFAGAYNGNTGNRGALFGNIQNTTDPIKITIQNLTLSNVVVNTSSGGFIGGVVGYFKGNGISTSSLNFTNCNLVNCSIAGSSGVGGLVGGAYSTSVNVEECKALHCDVVGSGGNVGGLLGGTDSARFVGCNVTNSTVASSGSNNVGGVLGGVNTASRFITCGVENTSVYANKLQVGGLLGYAPSASSAYFSADGCNVKNCVIASPFGKVGGLAGATESTSASNNIIGSHVVNCTIAGNSYVGGLVGNANPKISGGSDNSVEYSAVRGNAAVNLVCGSGNNLGCTADTDKNFLYNSNSKTDVITLYKKSGDSILLSDTTLWKTIYNATGAKSATPTVISQVTYLGEYGTVAGYGVVPLPKYIISTETVVGGTLTPSPTLAIADTTISVVASPAPGYHLNWTYYNKTGDSSTKNGFTGTFVLPAYDVTVGGDFKGNVTNVTFYNLSTPIESKLNTYAATTNTTPAAPTRVGYLFTEWNVSAGAGSGVAFNSTGYNDSGTWKYTGPHYTGGSEGTLAVYANWTANTYNVTFHANNGTSVTTKQQFTYDAAQNLNLNTFTYRGYSFVNWSTEATGTGTNYTDGQSVLNLTATQGGNVNLYAQWKANVTRITLNGNGGTPATATVNATFNSSTLDSVITDPIKPGYTFNGWYNATSGGVAVISQTGTLIDNVPGYTTSGKKWDNISLEITLFANWTANQTTVQYHNITELDTTLSYTFNQVAAIPSNPSRTGYTFNGWNLSSADGYQFNGNSSYFSNDNKWNYTGSESPLNVFGNWTANTYNVTFDNTTGTGIMANQTFTYDVAQALSLNNFTKSGYTFSGWNTTSAIGRGIDFTDGQSVMNLTAVDKETVTLYAVWTQIPAPKPQPQTSGSRETGKTIILTATPTPVPTITPTGQPTTVPGNIPGQQTRESPAPVVGLIAGLGAAAVLLRLRK